MGMGSPLPLKKSHAVLLAHFMFGHIGKCPNIWTHTWVFQPAEFPIKWPFLKILAQPSCGKLNSTFKCAPRMGLGWVDFFKFEFEILQKLNSKFPNFWLNFNRGAQKDYGDGFSTSSQKISCISVGSFLLWSHWEMSKHSNTHLSSIQMTQPPIFYNNSCYNK
jgi:hypothetical protein